MFLTRAGLWRAVHSRELAHHVCSSRAHVMCSAPSGKTWRASPDLVAWVPALAAIASPYLPYLPLARQRYAWSWAVHQAPFIHDCCRRAQLQEKVVPKVLAGKSIAALAITEPSGGSDVARIKTTAVYVACVHRGVVEPQRGVH